VPDFPIIDSHIHVYDPARLSYSWISRLAPPLRKRHDLQDYRASIDGIPVERAVVVEFLIDRGQHVAEAASAQEIAESEPLIGAFVAHAPVEKGDAVAADLEALVAIPAVRGIRRILEDGKLELALEPDFIAGVKTVGRFGLPFEIGVRHWGLTFGLELARRCPDVTFVLDHLATPGIRQGLREPWWTQIRELARLPNTLAKISGVMAGLDATTWAGADVSSYLAHAIECFGGDRLMFGSDWPMFTPILSFAAWVGIVDAVMSGAGDAERQSLFRGTAIRHYRLGA
jgi:L-fuconolactonase